MSQASDNTITYNKVLYDVSPEAYLNVTANTAYGSYNYLKCYCSHLLSSDILEGFPKYEFYHKPTNTQQHFK